MSVLARLLPCLSCSISRCSRSAFAPWWEPARMGLSRQGCFGCFLLLSLHRNEWNLIHLCDRRVVTGQLHNMVNRVKPHSSVVFPSVPNCWWLRCPCGEQPGFLLVIKGGCWLGAALPVSPCPFPVSIWWRWGGRALCYTHKIIDWAKQIMRYSPHLMLCQFGVTSLRAFTVCCICAVNETTLAKAWLIIYNFYIHAVLGFPAAEEPANKCCLL